MNFDNAEKLFDEYKSKPLPAKRKKLIFYRVEALKRNLLFQKDCEKLKQLKGLKNNTEYLKNKKRIKQRWGIDEHGFPIDVEPSCQVIEACPSGFLSVKINLNFPKKRILQQLKNEIDVWWSDYRLRKEEPDFKEARKLYKSEPVVLKGNVPQTYEQYLQVYDMRTQEKRSWSYINKTLKLNSLQTARNYYNAACKIIREGVPGFQPFPNK